MYSPDFRLLLITDRKNSYHPILKQVEECLKAGVRAVQLREKDLTTGELIFLAKKLRNVTSKYKAKFIINERIDVAMLVEADYLHLPSSSIDIEDIKCFNKKIRIGKSVHSIQEAIRAEKSGADYLLFGPIFSTPNKKRFGKPQGLNSLKEINLSVKIPVYAVGGINSSRARKCMGVGAEGVAVIRDLMCSENLKQRVGEYKKILNKL